MMSVITTRLRRRRLLQGSADVHAALFHRRQHLADVHAAAVIARRRRRIGIRHVGIGKLDRCQIGRAGQRLDEAAGGERVAGLDGRGVAAVESSSALRPFQAVQGRHRLSQNWGASAEEETVQILAKRSSD